MTQNKPIIGVLALQGAVELHRPHIEAAGAEFRSVKTPDAFDEVSAFILPGGESTTMLKLIENFDLWEPLAQNFAAKPVWGICAGSILMAQKVTHPQQKSFALLPMSIERNGYGRQLDSHEISIHDYPVSFIRAPIIKDIDERIDILAKEEGKPVWVSKGCYMATTFHPELSLNYPSPMHKHFVEMVRAAKDEKAA